MTCYNSELPIGPQGPTGPAGPQGEQGPAGPTYIPPYKVYTALLSQGGINAPTAVVLENTLGFIPTWSRISAGEYHSSNANWAIPVAAKKVFVIFTPINYYKDYNVFRACGDTNKIVISTGNYDINTNTYTPEDDLLSDGDYFTATSIEIRIYP